MEESKNLKRRFASALLTLLIALVAVLAATFAWYIYNTSSHTTKVKMAAGASASLQIGNEYDGTYGLSAVLKEFVGTLNPVSTDSIAGGFQKVYGFTNGSENQSRLVANLFGKGETSDYYMTSLYLRTSGETTTVYLSDIGYEDSDSENPISTAIRIGIVPHKAGKNKAVTGKEYIFAINTADNPEGEYNTATGKEGYVLDSSQTDGTTVKFTPYTSDNYCEYDKDSGVITLKKNSVPLCTVSGKDGEYGDSVQLDIYIWLEGCDKDCYNNLCGTTLKNLALSFAGQSE
jgi:hypothetical protein